MRFWPGMKPEKHAPSVGLYGPAIDMRIIVVDLRADAARRHAIDAA